MILGKFDPDKHLTTSSERMCDSGPSQPKTSDVDSYVRKASLSQLAAKLSTFNMTLTKAGSHFQMSSVPQQHLSASIVHSEDAVVGTNSSIDGTKSNCHPAEGCIHNLSICISNCYL